MSQRRKLIEVSIPLEEINAQSVREKSIRRGHPSTLHLWWARRPLAAARCVLYSQLVDDPSSFHDDYIAEYIEAGMGREAAADAADARVETEREVFHRRLAALADWNNLNDEALWAAAREDIRRSTDGNPPPVLDPFAGGGTIPVEAQRLGLMAYASDLNPVAVLINKAMIEIPPKFADRAPLNPDASLGRLTWKGAEGLAEDVRRYGEWMRDEAQRKIGHLYPTVKLDNGVEATVISWNWARTVVCPNPACGIQMPLVRSWWLSKKKGQEAYVVPRVVNRKIYFSIGHDQLNGPTAETDGTVGRRGATCIACATHVDLKYVRLEGQSGRLNSQLMTVVAAGPHGRVYVAPPEEHTAIATVDRPRSAPDGALPENPRDFKTPNYGLKRWSDLFSNRQLVALTTFSDLVGEARERVLADALATGMPKGEPLHTSGSGALAYADAVATYLGMGVSRMTDIANALARWENTKTQVRNLFGRQAIPMVWDYAEAPPFGAAAGSYEVSLGSLSKALERLPAMSEGNAEQADASSRSYEGMVISTDPPYYDNIGYSDLSDFFYVWLRRSLKSVHPDLFGTMLVPKAEELVANPYRHGGRQGAEEFFEDGFKHVFARARESATNDYPMTVYYAFKQSETNASGTASTGWETLLEGMVRNRWQVTATWPMRSELSNRMIASGTNALASSILLALRPRPENAGVMDRREFRDLLLDELPGHLRELQHGGIAPVDMAQAAIGPGMSIFSRYDRVLDADGSSVTVRDALQMINAVLDEVLSEQENDYDAATRWCLKWFAQFGFGTEAYGTAETLASALNISVSGLVKSGALESSAGKVRLLAPHDLEPGYRPDQDNVVTLWEVTLQTAAALSRDGVAEAGRILAGAADRVDAIAVRELSFLAFATAEKRKDSKTAQLFNGLVTSWNDVTDAARNRISSDVAGQGTLDLEGEGF